ncbi:MAG: Coenzyme F420 hydrogenase/dehydrogenase, beta subunit C-terminal domain [Paracoccaceae bacterium]|nr:Coenzyme F420 hydrogenase/dehydrogenase, beta subunit C-terminal domain [Paracoccaceae bacterium]
MVLGWAGDPAVRHRGATGGVLTALAQYLLRSGRAAFVLHARASDIEPTFGQAHVSETEEEILAGARSIYGPASVLVAINEALARAQPFAFVGKPCDISALRNLATLDPRVDALIKYWLTPVCGGFMPPEPMADFLRGHGIDPATVSRFSYRGDGCPGPTRVETADGQVHDFHYLDFWGEDESSWSLPHRCKVCADGIGEGADIAAADTWPGGSPDRVDSEADPGTNALVIRTQAGADLVEAAASDGALVLGDEVNPNFMNDVQPHQRKKNTRSRRASMGWRPRGGWCRIPRACVSTPWPR